MKILSFVIYVFAVLSLSIIEVSTGYAKNITLGEMIFVPSGSFVIGSKKSDGKVGIEIGLDEFPLRNLYIKGFWLDKYETTNLEYKEFIDATGNKTPNNETHPYDPYIWKNGTYPAGVDYKPIVLIDWYDADAYCRWKGKRLPTEEEWEKAARGTDRRIYPWGNKFDKMKANTLELRINMTSTVGSFPNGISPYGFYDMAGNVWEWTSSWYLRYPGNTSRNVYSDKTDKVTRGGSWLQPDYYGRTAERNSFPVKYKHRTVGVRCAKDG